MVLRSMKLPVLLGIVGAVLIGARPAWAANSIFLDTTGLPITATAAAALTGHEVGCDIAPAGIEDADIWVFRAEDATAIESLTVSFTSTTITVDTTSASTGGGVAGVDAWVAAPAGEELTAATATVDGDKATLNLLAACPAAQATGGLATTDPLAGLVPHVTPASPNPTTSQATKPPAPGQPETLPVSGTNVAEIAELGAGMVLTGVLLILFRGRRPKPIAEPDEDDIRRPVVMTRRF
jgi:hypothetical protein